MTESQPEDTPGEVLMSVKVQPSKTGNVYSIDAGVEDLALVQIRVSDHEVGLEVCRQLLAVITEEFDSWIAQTDAAVAAAHEIEDEEPRDG